MKFSSSEMFRFFLDPHKGKYSEGRGLLQWSRNSPHVLFKMAMVMNKEVATKVFEKRFKTGLTS